MVCCSILFFVHSQYVAGTKEFERLVAVAKLVLVLPHSNADAERVFSVVGLNKTKTRNSLALDGTLSSIMAIKMADLDGRPVSDGSPPQRSSRPPRRPQASTTLPTDLRKRLLRRVVYFTSISSHGRRGV